MIGTLNYSIRREGTYRKEPLQSSTPLLSYNYFSTDRCISELSNPDIEVQKEAAFLLKNIIDIGTRDKSAEEFISLMTNINKSFFNLLKNNNETEEIGALIAIMEVTDVLIDYDIFLTNFSHLIRKIITKQHLSEEVIVLSIRVKLYYF